MRSVNFDWLLMLTGPCSMPLHKEYASHRVLTTINNLVKGNIIELLFAFISKGANGLVAQQTGPIYGRFSFLSASPPPGK